MRKALIIIPALGALILLALLSFRSNGTVDIRFAGYTNDAAGLAAGMFLLSNRCSYAIDVHVPTLGMLRWLGPRESWLIQAPAPTNHLAWRLPVQWWRHKTAERRAQLNFLFRSKLGITQKDHYYAPIVYGPLVPLADGNRITVITNLTTNRN